MAIASGKASAVRMSADTKGRSNAPPTPRFVVSIPIPAPTVAPRRLHYDGLDKTHNKRKKADKKKSGKKKKMDSQNQGSSTGSKLHTESVGSNEPRIDGGSITGAVFISSPRLEMRHSPLSEARRVGGTIIGC